MVTQGWLQVDLGSQVVVLPLLVQAIRAAGGGGSSQEEPTGPLIPEDVAADPDTEDGGGQQQQPRQQLQEATLYLVKGPMDYTAVLQVRRHIHTPGSIPQPHIMCA